MSDQRFFGASASKARRGRPLSPKTLAIRSAVLGLPATYSIATVREVFYLLSVAGVVPKDEKQGYRPVQTQVLKLRREGRLPWEFIADSTRWMRKPDSYDSAEDALREIASTYRRNLWRFQGVRIEVWLEKDALAAVVMEATEPWDVPLMVSRGTSSATFLYAAAREAARAWERARIETVVYALYDYDAAGHRAARNVEKGLREHAPGVPITFDLLAVTEQQIAQWQLPSRPAKPRDPEAGKFKGEAVELDAIPPDRLIALVEEAILRHIDADAWRTEQAVEHSERELFARIVDQISGEGRTP